MKSSKVVLKSPREIEEMKGACGIVSEILYALKDFVRPGITTDELNEYAEACLKKRNAESAFRGYRGYPKSLCTSVNTQVVHGVPSAYQLKDGDILSIDFGVCYRGFFGDAAVSIPVGNVSEEAVRLIKVADDSLMAGIDMAIPGNMLSDISGAIQRMVEGNGYSVVRDFVGHGIGRALHEEPQIPNFISSAPDVRLKAGMVLAIEPMINAGGHEIVILEDGWTAVTKDGSLSAHSEHTVAVTRNGPLVLTGTFNNG